jgi:hypothetical protein
MNLAGGWDDDGENLCFVYKQIQQTAARIWKQNASVKCLQLLVMRSRKYNGNSAVLANDL